MVGWLEFSVCFQHKYGYVRDEVIQTRKRQQNVDSQNSECKSKHKNYGLFHVAATVIS